jgi:hypothetical protein
MLDKICRRSIILADVKSLVRKEVKDNGYYEREKSGNLRLPFGSYEQEKVQIPT